MQMTALQVIAIIGVIIFMGLYFATPGTNWENREKLLTWGLLGMGFLALFYLARELNL